jgi:hypothetical protein
VIDAGTTCDVRSLVTVGRIRVAVGVSRHVLARTEQVDVRLLEREQPATGPQLGERRRRRRAHRHEVRLIEHATERRRERRGRDVGLAGTDLEWRRLEGPG